MVNTSGLFKNIPCPDGPDNCHTPACVFSHEKAPKFKADTCVPEISRSSRDDRNKGHERKRLKLDDGSKAATRSQVPAEKPPEPLSRQPFVGALSSKSSAAASGTKSTSARNSSWTAINDGLDRKGMAEPPSPYRQTRAADRADGTGTYISGTVGLSKTVSTKSRPISPPPKKAAALKETLNPRLVPTNPAAHTSRLSLVRLVHQEVSRLNDLVGQSEDAIVKEYHLSPDAVVQLVLDEEAFVAQSHAKIYKNVMGNLIVRYRKMDISKWSELRKEAQAGEKEQSKEETAKPEAFKTGLTSAQEMLMLPRFCADLDGLDKYGFVLSPPSDVEIANSKEAIRLSGYWEVCDRCGSRFQVFPHRREDGALTSGGKCRFHWGKARKPKADKTDRVKGKPGALYACCETPIGTPGCVVHETHVFKATDRKRLASVLQFERTPENPSVKADLAVSFDCEMGYTTCGLEMIRLSAMTWPAGEKLIDVLVRPIGHILDLNTRFSGVTPEKFLDATELNDHGNLTTAGDTEASGTAEDDTRLRIVPSPAAARTLLLCYISPSTPLIGHGIENDLNVIRLCHPTIVDTTLLFPAPGGLPYRLALKRLAKEFLQRDIQIGGSAGHDSMEDARATGDLVRCKIAREWSVLKTSGWAFASDEEGGGFKMPSGWNGKGMQQRAGRYCVVLPNWWVKKRKRDEEDDEATENNESDRVEGRSAESCAEDEPTERLQA
jgi:RNA exonuclease 1